MFLLCDIVIRFKTNLNRYTSVNYKICLLFNIYKFVYLILITLFILVVLLV